MYLFLFGLKGWPNYDCRLFLERIPIFVIEISIHTMRIHTMRSYLGTSLAYIICVLNF